MFRATVKSPLLFCLLLVSMPLVISCGSGEGPEQSSDAADASALPDMSGTDTVANPTGDASDGSATGILDEGVDTGQGAPDTQTDVSEPKGPCDDPGVCDDELLCTEDLCDETTGFCTHAPDDDLCEDGDLCTGAEKCDPTLGCLPGLFKVCDDDLACTENNCDPQTGDCAFPVVEGCLIAEECVVDGAALPGAPCVICDPLQSITGYSAATDGTACDDGDPCLEGSTCTANSCGHGQPTDCDDGFDCTGDSCDVDQGGCVYEGDDALCDDNDPCTGDEACEVGTGCLAGTPLDCDDDEQCTEDTCDNEVFFGANYCKNTWLYDEPCDDGDPCTWGDHCGYFETSGHVCGSAHDSVDCDDEDSCTEDACDGEGGCSHVIPAGTLNTDCDDGDDCTADDACLEGGCAGEFIWDSACTGNTCSNTLDLEFPEGESALTYDGSFYDATNDYAAWESCCVIFLPNQDDCASPTNNGASGPDRAFRFTPSISGTYRFNLTVDNIQGFTGATNNSLLYILDTCLDEADQESACLGFDDNTYFNTSDNSWTGEEIDLLLVGQETVFVYAERAHFIGNSNQGFHLSISHLTTEEAQCDDEEDDDGDGVIDCDDPDCDNDFFCQEFGDHCGDGLDNDDDGSVDCADSLCADSPICYPTGLSCETAQSIGGALPLGVYASLEHGEHNFSGEVCGLAEDEYYLDAVYSFIPPGSGTYRVATADETTIDSIIYVSTTCPPTPEDCLGSVDEFSGMAEEAMEVELEEGTQVYIFVDGGYAGSSNLEYGLELDWLELLCDDGVDNDENGLVDCEDPNCNTAVGCEEFGDKCTDNADNDGDGDVDCADINCANHINCAQAGEICETPIVLGMEGATGDTSDFQNTPYGVACAGETLVGVQSGRDIFYRFTATEAGLYRFIATATDFNVNLAVAHDCPFEAGHCTVLDQKPTADAETAVALLGKDEVIYLAVDSDSQWKSGSFALSVSHESAEASCSDEQDNDGDQQVDCADPDCFFRESCPAQGDQCEAAMEVGPLPFSYSGLTHPYTDTLSAHCEENNWNGATTSCQYGVGAPDTFFAYTAPSDRKVRVHFTALNDFWGFIYLLGDCSSQECAIDYPINSTEQKMDRVVAGGESLIIVVDGVCDQSYGGGYTLEIEDLGAYEITCDDNTDNDGDQLEDCDDPDCANFEECALEGDACATAIALDLATGTYTGNTETAFHHYAPQTCDETVPALNGKDMVYSFKAPHDGRFRVTTEDEYNSEIYSAATCPPTPDSCGAPLKNLNIASKKTEIVLAKDESFYLFIDGGGYSSTSPAGEGAFSVHIEETEACTDNADNDGDALVDCDDPDCDDVEICFPPGDLCTEAIPINATGVYYGELAPLHETITDQVCDESASSAMTSGLDVFYEFTAPTAGDYRFSAFSPNDHPSLLIAEGCPITPDTCTLVDENYNIPVEHYEASLEAGDKLLLVINSRDWEGSATPFTEYYELFVRQLETTCDDQFDNNDNGKTDCEDPECWGQLSCDGGGQDCADAIELAGDLPIHFWAATTGSEDNSVYVTCANSQTKSDGPDRTHRFVAPADGTYRFFTNPMVTNFNSVLYLKDTCPLAADACTEFDNDSSALGQDEIEVELVKDQEIFAVVAGSYDSFGYGEGQYLLSVYKLP